MIDSNDHRELWWPSPSVELARTLDLELPDGFETVHGARLERIQVAFESWGTLNADGDNAILLVHPLASDPHASGSHWEQPDGWWDGLIGPGRVLDTDRYFVVCPNLLGGCYGTTGPRFPKPESPGERGVPDGQAPADAAGVAEAAEAAEVGEAAEVSETGDAGVEPYLDDFPLLTPLDMMRVQRLFAEQLGIRRLHRVIGPSMGAMVAWEWAIEGGDYLGQSVAIAAPLRTTAYQIGLNWLQRRGIELDLSGDVLAATAGQMIARGVGMLSYRSQLGMEEKFGREWFKKPGSTLGKRGMYNVESWLRHHGKRIVKRFDPYTYILFSRAMDLHDVGEGRGGFLAALDNVQCDVLAVGISSDQLYTPAEVRLGVDMLEHLGKGARYAEIRSPHGHDAFLLEVDQLTAILGLGRAPSVGPLPDAGRELRTVRIGILGAGQVATRLLKLLARDGERIARESGVRFEPVAFAEKDEAKSLDDRFASLERMKSSRALAERSDLDALLDLTRGVSSLETVARALGRGISVVTPNKELIQAHGEELENLALERGVRLAYHNSIAAGWPLLYSVERPLGRGRIAGLRALLSTTCNTILSQMELGRSYADGLGFAREAGYTEPDPSLDVTGWDAVQKLLILLAHSRQERYRTSSVFSRGIENVDAALVEAAPRAGYRIRLVAIFADGDRPIAGVLPCAVGEDSHLGGVTADTHVLVIEGADDRERVFLGKGAGEMPVATAVLGDLVGVSDPSHSWTGRFPVAATATATPRFARHLHFENGTVRIGEASADAGGEKSVPLLDSLIQEREPGNGGL